MTSLFPPIILASSSPRRKDILSQMRIQYTCISPDIHEHSIHKDPVAFCSDIAAQKASAVQQYIQNNTVKNAQQLQKYRYILSADTIVYCNTSLLQKPATVQEAKEMLSMLSDTQHTVYSALCLLDMHNHSRAVHCASAKVQFAPITPQERDTYLASNEWQGVAGGYRIQGLGACFITSIEGEYSTVQGLPIRLLYDILISVVAKDNTIL